MCACVFVCACSVVCACLCVLVIYVTGCARMYESASGLYDQINNACGSTLCAADNTMKVILFLT